MPSNQRQIIEQAAFAYKEQGRKQTDAIKSQNERIAALTNKDDHKDNYKEIFEELVKGKFDEIRKLTDEITQNDLTHYFTGNTFIKRFDDFNKGIELS